MGSLRGTGYAQSIVRLLQNSLQDFQHTSETVINVRIYPIIRNKDACFAASFYQGSDLTPENKKGLIFSAPTYLFFYHGLITRIDQTEAIQRHQKDGLVDLTSLIQDRDIIGSFQPGRTYSRWLMEIFAVPKNTNRLFRWSGNNNLTRSIFKLLDAKRVDYFIDYSLMLNYHERSTGEIGKYRYFPLQEHAGRFGLGAVACKDGTKGRQIINRINHSLETLRHTPAYTSILRTWLVPAGLQEEYWHLWEQEALPLKQ